MKSCVSDGANAMLGAHNGMVAHISLIRDNFNFPVFKANEQITNYAQSCFEKMRKYTPKMKGKAFLSIPNQNFPGAACPQEYNGKSFFLDDKWENSASLHLFTDEAGAHGFETVFGSHWCYGEWPKEWLGKNIAILEFYSIVPSLILWGDHIRDRCITFFTDNEALVHVINKSTCRDTSLMIFVHHLELVCLRHNIILFKAKHISGFKNTLADALSRLQIERFRKIAPAYMDPTPTAIPSHLLSANWHL